MIFPFQRHCKMLLCAIVLLSSLIGLPSDCEADSNKKTVEDKETNAQILPTVTVEATRIAPLGGVSRLNRKFITKIPSRNNNTSDLLKLMPGVQMPEGADSSNTAGEIAPATVSISGGRPYDNNFLIDGVGNDSLLDPQFDTQSETNNVPGHPQEIFLLNNLIQDISVLRSNIPARYGGFTGGVIVVETIDPADNFSGNFSYQATHSNWSKFHIDPDKQADFDNSITEEYQPRFFKQKTSGTIHTPINNHSGLVFNYSLLDSDIPLHNLGTEESQNRSSENYFIKYKNSPSDETTISLSGTYAPYEGDHFLKETKNSTYRIKLGGYTLSGKIEKNSNLGDSEFTLAFKTSHNSRSGPDNWFNWRNTGTKDWGPKNYSKEGGYGDIDKEQQSFTGNLHHDFNSFRVRSSIHSFNTGMNLNYADTKYDRLGETSVYAVASATPSVDCNGDNSDCIDGQQFMWFKNIYPEDKASAQITQLAAYVEDSIVIKRLTLRTGLRGSWDDYLENSNLAPRMAAAFDLFANGRTTIIAGANRYYGRNLLTLKLNEQKKPSTRWKRSTTLDINNNPQPWILQPPNAIPTSRVTDLDTPYSDEFTFGLRQEIFGGLLELDYIDRQGHDLIVTRIFAKDPISKIVYSEWSNAGRLHHQQTNLSWDRDWKKSSLRVTATLQKTTGNSDTYTNSDADFNDRIWYKGALANRDELLLSDYNRPFRATVIYTTKVANRLSFSNVTTYRSPYKSTIKSDDPYILPDSTPIDAYEDVTNDQALIFDWKFAYNVLQKKNLNLALTLDIYNVFNHQTNLGGSDTDYELGRQVWLGASCDF